MDQKFRLDSLTLLIAFVIRQSSLDKIINRSGSNSSSQTIHIISKSNGLKVDIIMSSQTGLEWLKNII